MKRRALALLAALAVCVPAHALSLGRGPMEEHHDAPRARTAEKPRVSRSDYEKIQELFLKDDHAGVVRAAEAYLSDPRAKDSDAVLHIQALSLMKLGRGAEARDRLRRLERSGLDGGSRAGAAVSTADSYFEDGIYTSAHESYKRVLEKYPAVDEAAYVRARLAESAARMGRQVPPVVLRQQSVEEKTFFTVQVGSFERESNARSLEERLKRAHFDAFVESSGRQYRVRVGRLESREAASVLETELRAKGYPTKILP